MAGPSRHSGGSRIGGSFSRSSFSSSRSSFSKLFSRPSSHSFSSHKIFNSSNKTRINPHTYNHKSFSGPRIINRPLYNQPLGYYSFWNWYRPRPIIYYCIRHNYTYYPESWTSNGVEYKSGYYDENGKYYKEKPFIEKKVGKIYTKCPNCSHVKDYDYMDFDELENCPECGTRMIIADEDDDIFIHESNYQDSNLFDKVVYYLKYIGLGILCTLMLYLPFSYFKTKLESKQSNTIQQEIITHDIEEGDKYYNPDMFGSTIYLKRIDNNTYQILPSYDGASKKIVWINDYESYYNQDDDYWIWYNPDYNVWQYWYEPISKDFGDYGWIEYDEEDKQWWIETGDRGWIIIPDKYDTSKLWRIE